MEHSNALLDVWSFLALIEPYGFLVAREDGRLVGYAIFVQSLSRVQREAVRSGQVFKWLMHALMGRYKFRIDKKLRTLRNKAKFLVAGQRFRTRGDAQLLNIAVEPGLQGKGIAKQLVRVGLSVMRSVRVSEVRLEVRPWNVPAVRVYESTGWREVGRTRDLEGEWIVMVANP
ncbi:MAG: GNAT family N-acetyltransferase [Candidatus Eremiobacteraeota bacterium]|nr:GNAT family N-acetyltransferase [Candidatus Eremiobacteraeota bacterium]